MRGGRFRDGRRRVGSRGDGPCQSLVLLPRRGHWSTGGLNVASTGGVRSRLRHDQQVGRKIRGPGHLGACGNAGRGASGLPGWAGSELAKGLRRSISGWNERIGEMKVRLTTDMYRGPSKRTRKSLSVRLFIQTRRNSCVRRPGADTTAQHVLLRSGEEGTGNKHCRACMVCWKSMMLSCCDAGGC